MRDARWTAEETRLWNEIMNDSVPKPPGLKAKERGIRAKAQSEYARRQADQFAAGWNAYRRWLPH